MQLSVSLPPQEWQAVLALLQRNPMEQVRNLVQNIEMQLMQAQSAERNVPKQEAKIDKSNGSSLHAE